MEFLLDDNDEFSWETVETEKFTVTGNDKDAEKVDEAMHVEDEEKSSEEDAGGNNDDLTFLRVLKKSGKCLVEKSQTPAMKEKKKTALKEMTVQLLDRGLEFNENQIKKKVENMKARLKKKIDSKKTGNVPIALTGTDKLLMDILEGNENPSITRLKCKYYSCNFYENIFF